MRTIILLLTVTSLVFITSACEEGNGSNNDDRKVVGTGPIVTRNPDFTSFDKIENAGVANFYITIGSPQSVELKAQQNIIDVMTYEVVGYTLKIGIEDGVSIDSQEEIRFDITIPSITRIDLTGVGDFVLSGEDQDELIINLTGVGNVLAYDMKVDACTITSIGVGNIQVHVISTLDVIITGVGNVYYKGNPTITSSVTGIGSLINANP